MAAKVPSCWANESDLTIGCGLFATLGSQATSYMVIANLPFALDVISPFPFESEDDKKGRREANSALRVENGPSDPCATRSGASSSKGAWGWVFVDDVTRGSQIH